MSLKSLVLGIFLVSLLVSDTFYGYLGITQSLFLLPLLSYFVLSGKLLPASGSTRVLILLFIAIITSSLMSSMFNGIIEWYRTVGGVILATIITSRFTNDNSFKLQLFVLSTSVGLIVLGYYLGLWYLYPGTIRLTALYHDPNRLGHLLLFGYSTTVSLIVFLNKPSKFIVLVSVLYTIPVLATVSRTTVICFIFLFLIAIFYSMNTLGRFIMTIILSIGIISMYSIKVNVIGNSSKVLLERIEAGDVQREKLINSSMSVIGEKPILGVGVATFVDPEWRINRGLSMRKYVNNSAIIVPTSSHNGFLDILMIGGLVLFIPFIGLVFMPIFRLNKISKLQIPLNEKNARKLTILLLTITVVIVNLTYSLYYGKLVWWSIAICHVLINRRSSVNLLNKETFIYNDSKITT